MKLECTYWPSVKAPIGKPFTTTFEALAKRFETPLEVAEKMAIPGWAPVRFTGGRRALAAVEAVSAIGFDFDELECWFDELCGCFRNAAIVHETYSSAGDAPRARAVVALSRPISAAEHARLWPALADVMTKTGHKPDPAAKDPSRLWFVPARAPGRSGRFFSRLVEGPPLDVDSLLERIPEPAPVVERVPQRGPLTAPNVRPDVIERARRYLATCDVAIAGQGGHRTTFVVCQKLTRGFGLDAGTAFELLLEGWAQACKPMWSMEELIRKVNQSAKHGRMAVGELRDAQRRRAG